MRNRPGIRSASELRRKANSYFPMGSPRFSITYDRSHRIAGFSVDFDAAAHRLTDTPIGLAVELDGCLPAGELGGPALPMLTCRVALPPGVQVGAVKARARTRTPLGDRPVHVAPMQLPRVAGGGHGGITPVRKSTSEWIRPPDPPFIAPIEARYAAVRERPTPLARLVRTEWTELLTIATFEILPVGLTPSGILEYASGLYVEFSLAPSGPTVKPTPMRSAAQVEQSAELARGTVINPSLVGELARAFPLPPPTDALVDYVIVTDSPAGEDLPAAFQRLVDWKTQRGLKCRIVRVSDLVNGTTTRDDGSSFAVREDGLAARDTAEVIRNFLKWARNTWSVTWALLGGTPAIVPTGHVNMVGWVDGIDIREATADPPASEHSYWTGSFLKVNVWLLSAADPSYVMIARADTYEFVPYDPTGSLAKGWFYSDPTLGTPVGPPSAAVLQANASSGKEKTPVSIRLNWPAADHAVLGFLKWLCAWGDLATDAYYSSLVAPTYDQPGKHDWYLVENGLFGKVTWNHDLDGMAYTSDVSVGRAPVATKKDADAFVDKVIRYEQYRAADGTQLDPAWARELAMLATTWAERGYISKCDPSAADPLASGGYYHAPGSKSTILNLSGVGRPSYAELFAAVSSSGEPTLIAYDAKASLPGRSGWFYATDRTGMVASTASGSALPTSWIAVYSATADAPELSPQYFILDDALPDGSMADEETIRRQLSQIAPLISLMDRLYEDDADLAAADRAACPVDYITPQRSVELLKSGGGVLPRPPHLVMMSGHSNEGGVMSPGGRLAPMLTIADAGSLANSSFPFIANVCGCRSGNYEQPCVGTALVTNAAAGAVAYVGHSRNCNMGYSAPFQRGFFAALSGGVHLGTLNDTRLSLHQSDRSAAFTLNLLGDPEMPVWVGSPDTLQVSHAARIGDAAQSFTVNVACNQKPVAGAVVCLTLEGKALSAKCDAAGTAVLAVSPMGPGSMAVLVTAPNALPYQASVAIVSLSLVVAPTVVPPGIFDPIAITATVTVAGAPASGVTITAAGPQGWTGRYATGANGSVVFSVDRSAFLTPGKPVARSGSARSILLIYGWLDVTAMADGFVPRTQRVLMELSIPYIRWWRPQLPDLLDFLNWPVEVVNSLPDKVRADKSVVTAANTMVAGPELLLRLADVAVSGQVDPVMAALTGWKDGPEASRAAQTKLLELSRMLESAAQTLRRAKVG